MKRYLRLLRVFLANSLQLELEYRANLLMNLCNSLLVFCAGLVVLAVMFRHADAFGGWSFHQALALYGVFLVLQAFIELMVRPNLNKLPEHIRTGSLDLVLLQPASSQFQVSLRHVGIWQAPELLLGIGVIVYGMAALDSLNLKNLLLLAGLLIAAALIVYAIWFMLLTTTFWFVKVENVSELFSAFFEAGRFPASSFPPWVRFLLTFVVPIAFITTVPASAAVDRLDWQMALGSLAIAALLLGVNHLLWRYALATYTSASS